MAQIIYVPQTSYDDTQYAPPQQQQAAPQAQGGGGVGVGGLIGAALGGAALNRYGAKIPKLFGRGAPAPALAASAPAPEAPVPPEVPPAPSPQPAAPAEPPVDLTKALDPKAPPPTPKTGFAGRQPTQIGSGMPFGTKEATQAKQAAQDAAQAAAMANEGGGSRSAASSLFDEAGGMAMKGAGRLAAGAGGLATLLNAIHQSGIVAPAGGHGAAAVANAGPLTSLVEPAAMHASAQAAYHGLPTAAQGLIGLLGGGASVGARALDATDLPALAGGLGGYLAHGLGLDRLGGGVAAPAQAAQTPAEQKVVMSHNPDGSAAVTVNGVRHHPATHTVEDFVNNARAAGLTLDDLGKMYALHQHFSPQQNAAALALQEAQQAHQQGRPQPNDDFTRTLERWGLNAPALYP